VGGKPKPSPCILDGLKVLRVVKGRKVYRSADGNRLYTWDSLHGEVEVFTAKGKHLGALDAVTGRFLKGPVKGRTIDT
jgi:putative cytotoxic protein